MTIHTAESLIDSRLKAQRAILVKAQEDAAFRAQLKADPRTALKQAFGINWDPSSELEVVEETSARCVLVLPPRIEVAANEDELSDDELELVAAANNNHQQPPICYTNRFGKEQCGVPNAEGGT